jgi:hypothetical protein
MVTTFLPNSEPIQVAPDGVRDRGGDELPFEFPQAAAGLVQRAATSLGSSRRPAAVATMSFRQRLACA